MPRRIEVDLVGDTSDFGRAMDSAGDAVGRLEADLKSADAQSSRFDDGLDKTTSGLENTTGKLRSTNDLVSGFADVVGLSLPPQAQMIVGFADMADGMSGLLGPALKASKAAFASMNATMLANPIFLVVAAIVALVAIFVIAYTKVGWFHDGVDAAMRGIKKVTLDVVGFITNLFMNFTGPGLLIKHFDKIKAGAEAMADGVKGAFSGIADVISAAINALRSAWNNTLGGKGWDKVEIPFAPDLPGFHIPMLAGGGPARAGMAHIVGERGPELFVPRMSGTVIPNRALGGGGTIVIRFEGAQDEFAKWFRKITRVEGGDVQVVWGVG